MGKRNKALLQYGDQSFLSTIAGQCALASIEEIVVVVAEPHQRETREAAESLGLRWVCNEDPGRGMASSVACGFQFARDNFSSDYCWLWPVDVPAVSAVLLATLAARSRPDAVVIPSVGERGGHPVLVARGLWEELAACTQEEEGARSVFRRDASRVVRVPVDEEGAGLDVDCPEDLRRLGGESRP
jgi:CTP:molybdopterin cytidylyltransferase MocA